jgi:putative two-component system response regulator
VSRRYSERSSSDIRERAAHAERVAEIALDLTAVVRPELAATEGIGHAYLLHDVGKIGVPDAILLKPGP